MIEILMGPLWDQMPGQVDLWRLKRQRQWTNPLDPGGQYDATHSGAYIFFTFFFWSKILGQLSLGVPSRVLGTL